MPKTCDNKSVGVIIKDGDNYALIERINFPISYAFVAGHVDGNLPAEQAKEESKEESNLTVDVLSLVLDKTFKNPCKREGGSYHHWKVFEATKWSGVLKAGSDAKKARWITRKELRALADHTQYFSEKLGIPIEDLAEFTLKVVEDPEWQESPGLEPVWTVILAELGIV